MSNDLIPLRDYVCECAVAIRLHTRLLKTFSVMYKILFILLMSTFFSVSSAQNIVLTGEVINPITNEGLHEAVIKVINAANDSVLASTKAKLNMIVEGKMATQRDTSTKTMVPFLTSKYLRHIKT